MKKIIAASALILILSGASAQFRERGFAFAPRTTVVVASNPYWGYYPYVGLGFCPYFGYPYYYPYNANYGYRPYSKLDREIADINHDYDQRIESVRNDKTLSGKEKRSEIRNLKKERDNAIDNTKHNYFNELRNQQSPQQQQAPPVQQQAPKEATPQTPAAESQSTTTSSAM